jgi:tetraacyldisaccharide 4'-kinase
MNLPPTLRWLLQPLSVLYREVVRVRVWMYGKGVLKQRQLKTPVISVGNLTVGGTGKTPMVIWLAERLLAQGQRVGILSRGYKGTDSTSDEIDLMRHRLQGRVAVGVGKDRYQQALLLEPKGVDIFLLDDGFQHLQLARDVNILLMDASRPLGHELLLPAGSLREPLSEMARADLLVFTRAEISSSAQTAIAKLQDYPVFSASTQLLGFLQFGTAAAPLLSSEQLGAGPFFAFCGIGNPAAFFADLNRWRLPCAGTKSFPDHHRFSANDAIELQAAARQAGAHALLTTEKDAQNLAGVQLAGFPVYIAVIELQIAKEEAFWAAIQRRLDTRKVSA